MSEAPEFVPSSGHDTAVPRFYIEPIQNNAKTMEMGRPIFEEREMVEISIPGDRKTVAVHYVKQEHKERWPRQYAAFKAGAELHETGTPIREWGGVNRAQAEELAYMGVHTVEALAALDDAGLGRVTSTGGFALRDKAKRFIETAEGNAPMEKLAAELADRDAIIAQLKSEFETMRHEVERLRAESAAKSTGGPV